MERRRHRQHLDVAVGELDQPIGTAGEPEIAFIAPAALRGQEFEQRPLELLLRRHRLHCSPPGLEMLAAEYSAPSRTTAPIRHRCLSQPQVKVPQNWGM